jgi:L-alanine-DL-glutamate epimerase-like enolase superfamily enzyme
MAVQMSIRAERLPLHSPFRISRGVKTHAEVVVVDLRDGDRVGRGECVPYARYGETTDSVMAQLQRFADGTVSALPAGAARNAFDCATWDLAAQDGGPPVAVRLGLPAPRAVPSAVTISLDEVAAMAEAARAAAGVPLIKVKLGADDPAARLAAVAQAAPNAKLIVDPNEGWTAAILNDMAREIARWPVALVEQPLPADEDEALRGLSYPVPICADEAVHTREDLDALVGKYAVVNIKLDKAGGLTEAAAMLRAARTKNLGVMVGCMVASSLAIAPAMLLATEADFVDLDGPWWLANDRAGGCRFEAGVLYPPQSGFWGEVRIPA